MSIRFVDTFCVRGAPDGTRTRKSWGTPASKAGAAASFATGAPKKRVCQGVSQDRPRVEWTRGANPYPWDPRRPLRTMADPGSTITRDRVIEWRPARASRRRASCPDQQKGDSGLDCVPGVPNPLLRADSMGWFASRATVKNPARQ